MQIIVAADFKAAINQLLASGVAAFSIAYRASSSRPCLIFLQMEVIKFGSSLFEFIGLHDLSCPTTSTLRKKEEIYLMREMGLLVKKVIRTLLRDMIKFTSRRRTMAKCMVYLSMKKVEHQKRKQTLLIFETR